MLENYVLKFQVVAALQLVERCAISNLDVHVAMQV